MSSFLRRIERQRVPSNKVHPVYDLDGKIIGLESTPAREKFYLKRGERLGVTREKAPKPNSLGARGSRRKTKFRPFRNQISEVVGEA